MMQHELKLKLVDALETFMHEHGLTQSKVAERSGVNASYLINIRKKDFTIKSGDKVVNIADKYFKRIADFIGFQTEKNLWPTRATKQLTEIQAIAKDAKENAETAWIIGETGSGKSFNAELFKKRYPKEVFIVKVGSSDNLGDLIEKMLEALGLEPVLRTKSARLRQIAAHLKHLSEEGLEPAFLFDESEYMKIPALCSFKELYDYLNGWCSLIVLGTSQLLQNVEKLRLRNKPGIPQLYRRIKFKIHTLPTIDRTFKDFLEGVKPDLKAWLQQHCDNYGELHDVLVPAMREADRTGNELTVDFVKVVLGIKK